MAENEYLNLTIAPTVATWEHEIKKSRFILNVARINSEEEARDFIARISQQERKANHNVWTYVLGEHDEIQRYSDDGEPAGTAGVPMLEVLKNNQVHNVVAVVTRYFGGIKLGAGGLIRAYAGTVADGLVDVGLVELVARQAVTISVSYSAYDSLKYWLDTNDHIINDTQYTTGVDITVPVLPAEMSAFESDINDLLAGQVTFTKGDEQIFELPYDRSVSAATSSLK
ncbi:YigZ family protein [Weissella tructae]|uniref:YvyE n=2 Tax=Weissella TaxID=46255 RepID=A0A075U5C7_9LACO|nr:MULTISPECIES: YigZ family protein [Weissella]AIG65332.1 YvyE [Weissella tructae]AIM62646.1 YvyE [Weissella ceti]AIM63981.1 YvyE [Weissella ceti]ELA07735.1 hypothetical protein WCNC_01990 [Weissella ceti NC36]QVV91713.1 YigZ family protein [Weissella tructae]